MCINFLFAKSNKYQLEEMAKKAVQRLNLKCQIGGAALQGYSNIPLL